MPVILRGKVWAAGAALMSLLAGTAAGAVPTGKPVPWQLNFQPAASPVMENIESFHTLLLYIITLISLFVLALLAWIAVRYNHRANPVQPRHRHQT